MSTATRVSSALTSRYATALLDLAAEGKKIEKIEADMNALESLLESSAELRDLVHDPRISKSKQKEIVETLVKKAKLQDLTGNFLNVLVENRRLNILDAVIVTIRKLLSEKRGEKTAFIKVAQDLSDKQRKELEDALKKASGSAVSLNIEVDPALLGGMVITMGSQMIDDSVAGKLERLKMALINGNTEGLLEGSNENEAPKAKTKAKPKK